ncbi:MAG TPA: hypothetical protein VK447_00725 [Myxococcaceae bacterium]|nr:hypothetical protein [Myxococcaceae bacterium]
MPARAEFDHPRYELRPVLRDGDALLIVPPFGPLNQPSTAAHRLQDRARRERFGVSVLYVNLMLAELLGEEAYRAILDAPASGLLGERVFYAAAYGLPPFGVADPEERQAFLARTWRRVGERERGWLDLERLLALEARARRWVEEVARAVLAARRFRIIGCVSAMQQTAASVALLNQVKALRPDVLTLLVGGTREGEHARELLSMGARIDYVLAGEGAECFSRFLDNALGGDPPGSPILRGPPDAEDARASPDFTELLEQRRYFLREERAPEQAKP